MGIVEKLESYGVFVGDVGLASLLCADNPKQIKKAWDTGVKFIVLKTMMDLEDRPGEAAIREVQTADDNMTFYHTGTTSKEQLNFRDDSEGIVSLLNGLYDSGIVAIPSIGTKGTDIETWEKMESVLARTEARVLELNFRYLYRGLLDKYRRLLDEDNGMRSNEYRIIDTIGKAQNANKAKYLANREFGYILAMIRRIFPQDEYSLIAKLWSSSEIKLHLMYAAESGFDAVTLVNSKKKQPPVPFENLPEGKIPQVSGLELRQNRDYAFWLIREMRYRLPIFASGGVAMEAIRKIDITGATEMPDYEGRIIQKNFQDAVKDIKSCFEQGASYVQLGSVGYFKNHYGSVYDTITRIMQELNGPPKANTPAKMIAA